MLTNTVLMVVFGRLADILGRRELYLTGVGLFTVMSVVAGFAPSVKALIACRVLQAAAAAMLMANSGGAGDARRSRAGCSGKGSASTWPRSRWRS